MSVRNGHPSEVIADSGFLLGDYQMEIPYGYCHCGCGELAPIAKRTYNKIGHIKGQPIKYICFHYGMRLTKNKNPMWNGGTTNDIDGRIQIHKPEHHRANKRGYVFRSFLVAEEALGKPLLKYMRVHHVDGDVTKDDKNNLVICENETYHKLLHKRERAFNACGNPNYLKCGYCKKYDDPKNLYVIPNGNSGRHRICQNKYSIERRKIKKLRSN